MLSESLVLHVHDLSLLLWLWARIHKLVKKYFFYVQMVQTFVQNITCMSCISYDATFSPLQKQSLCGILSLCYYTVILV